MFRDLVGTRRQYGRLFIPNIQREWSPSYYLSPYRFTTLSTTEFLVFYRRRSMYVYVLDLYVQQLFIQYASVPLQQLIREASSHDRGDYPLLWH